MRELKNKEVQCPYCWEWIEILVDCSISKQDYVEDCEVCCRPIQFKINVLSVDDVQVISDREEDG